jgi:hypothetical protein
VVSRHTWFTLDLTAATRKSLATTHRPASPAHQFAFGDHGLIVIGAHRLAGRANKLPLFTGRASRAAVLRNAGAWPRLAPENATLLLASSVQFSGKARQQLLPRHEDSSLSNGSVTSNH